MFLPTTHKPLRTAEEWAQKVEASIALAKTEIFECERTGQLPAGVLDFATLHDYMDANELGGLCEPGWLEYENGEWTNLCEKASRDVQEAIHVWLKTRGPLSYEQARQVEDEGGTVIWSNGNLWRKGC